MYVKSYRRIAQTLTATLLLHMGVIQAPAQAGNWPMWHHDAARGASTADALPSDLKPSWVRVLPTPRPAWPSSQLEVQYDASYEPVAVGQLLLVGSNVDDSLTAFDTRSGKQAWKFFTDGPIRFAPVVDDERVFVASDDGYLYCLALADGSLNWRVRGGPSERRVLGVDRLISSWPVRGGPVVADGNVYFTAGIWPFMGIFIHAVDVKTGKIVWTADETGASFITHPHGAPSFGSVVPQGYLAVSGDYLIVPGGRSLPAVFDRHTGKLVHFDFGGKESGGYDVIATKHFVSTRGESIHLGDGAALGTMPLSVAGGDVLIGVSDTGSLLVRTAAGEITEKESALDRRGRREKSLAFVPQDSWELMPSDNAVVRPMLVAGDRVFAASDKGVVAYPWAKPDVTGKDAAQPGEVAPVWSADLPSPVWSMIAADDRLFVVTLDGQITCFSTPGETATGNVLSIARLDSHLDTPEGAEVAAILKAADMPEGYGLVVGNVAVTMIDELLAQSSLYLFVLSADVEQVAQLREHYSQQGLYGERISAFVGTPSQAALPPYFASLIVADLAAPEFESDATALCHSLRPYGGTLAVRLPEGEREAVIGIAERELGAPENTQQDAWTIIRRLGALPGAGSWTHQYADAANSVVSKDSIVKAPLGLLWFGGPSHDEVLPRHGHGPTPQVAGGRVVIEGPDMLRATDVYTGRLLWQKPLPGVGKYYDNTSHHPGAGEIGSNYVTLADEIYVIYGDEILALDAATGDELRRFAILDAEGKRSPIGVLYVADDLLVATASPVSVDQRKKDPAESPELAAALEAASHAASSRRLVAFDRHSGKQLWSRDAGQAIRHNGLAVAAGKLFMIDGLSPKQLAALARRGIKPSEPARLFALDAQTGAELWSTSEDVFGTFLNYSVEHDILLQGGSAYRDRAQDESDRGLIAYRGTDGSVLWKNLELRYNGPCLLWRDKIITNGNGGFQVDLLTGEENGWKFARMYGCNTILGSEHLLTFRSGAAGFCDLATDSGTGNMGGFRSSCTSNLIVADGVLSAPEYTRTCNCAYQVQSSLAMIEMPEAEMWTFRPSTSEPASERRLGLNFGAPGDRRSPEGTLWLEYPSIAGPSPGLPVEITPESATYFLSHSSEIASADETSEASAVALPWVAASGIRGAEKLKIELPELLAPAASYTIRLHFVEPDQVEPGQRLFDVTLEGQPVASQFDIAAEAGGSQRAFVRAISGVKVEGDLDIELKPVAGAKVQESILCGVELIAEGVDTQETTSK